MLERWLRWRDRCYSSPWGKCLPADSLGMQPEQEAEGIISGIVFVSALLLACVFGFPFPLTVLFSLNPPLLLDFSIFILFLQYWSFPSRLRAALRGQWKSADIISQDPVIAWVREKWEGRGMERDTGRRREGSRNWASRENTAAPSQILHTHAHPYADELDHEALKHTPTAAASLC